MLAHQGDLVPVVMLADRLIAAGAGRRFLKPTAVAMFQAMWLVAGEIATGLFTQGGSVKKSFHGGPEKWVNRLRSKIPFSCKGAS